MTIWPRALRWRLVVALFLAILSAWGVAVVASYQKAEHEAVELMDGSLAQYARHLLVLAQDRAIPIDEIVHRLDETKTATDSQYELQLEFIIQRLNGQLVARTSGAPSLISAVPAAYSESSYDGREWRIFRLDDMHSDYRVLVYHAIDLREVVALEIAGRTALPVGLTLLPLLLLSYGIIRSNLRALETLERQLATRSSEHLAQVMIGAAPAEIVSLEKTANALLSRLENALENERQFTANAAHELRTPLAAIRLHGQLALAQQEPARAEAIRRSLQGCERATRIVEQLLRLARLDPLDGPPQLIPLEPAALLRQHHDEFPLSPGRPPLIERYASDLPFLYGDPDLLGTALGNLLENALRYSPPDTTVTLFAERCGDDICLGVEDGGPGCPDDELSKLHQRFYRGKGVTANGSGLGLAIVDRIAQLHGAKLQLENLPQGGFRAAIIWSQGAKSIV